MRIIELPEYLKLSTLYLACKLSVKHLIILKLVPILDILKKILTKMNLKRYSFGNFKDFYRLFLSDKFRRISEILQICIFLMEVFRRFL